MFALHLGNEHLETKSEISQGHSLIQLNSRIPSYLPKSQPVSQRDIDQNPY